MVPGLEARVSATVNESESGLRKYFGYGLSASKNVRLRF